jgi:hypothetical protein
MLAGFETIFPTLLEMAKDVGLDMPCDDPALQDIYAKRDLKLAKYDNYTCLLVNIFRILFCTFHAKKKRAHALSNQKNDI